MPAIQVFDERPQRMKNVSSVLSVLGESLSTKTPHPHSATLPPLSNIRLPQAPSIATILNTHCIRQSVARELIHTYERHVSDLRKCTEAQIQRLVQHYQNNAIACDILEKQVTRYVSLYRSGVKHWYTLISNQIKHGKSEFNSERIPLLITYFKHNAYPSTHDRIWLARETRNTPQQISIWNRRRRSRKAGVELKRAGPDEIPRNLLAETLETSLPTDPVKRPRLPSPQVAASEEAPFACSPLSGTSTFESHSRRRTHHDSINLEIPPYVARKHPTMSSCWSLSTKTHFPEPNWDRKSTLRRNTRHLQSNVISVDDLSSILAVKLRLFCSHPSPSPVAPWYTGLYTYPPPSPLPALIQPKKLSFSAIGFTSPTMKSSLKRKRSDMDEGRYSPCPKRFRSLSTSKSSPLLGGGLHSSGDSSCKSSSPGLQTPPSALLPFPPSSRFVDWSKYPSFPEHMARLSGVRLPKP